MQHVAVSTTPFAPSKPNIVQLKYTVMTIFIFNNEKKKTKKWWEKNCCKFNSYRNWCGLSLAMLSSSLLAAMKDSMNENWFRSWIWINLLWFLRMMSIWCRAIWLVRHFARYENIDRIIQNININCNAASIANTCCTCLIFSREIIYGTT